MTLCRFLTGLMLRALVIVIIFCGVITYSIVSFQHPAILYVSAGGSDVHH